MTQPKDTLINTTITRVDAQIFNVPLAEVLTDAKHGDHTHFELVTATIGLSDGSTGTGYTYTGGKGGRAILAMIEHDLAPFLVGRDGADVEALYEAMQWHVHYVARGGIASFAISAVDIALWDLRGKRTGAPLWQMAGGTSNSCRAYCGGIDLNFSLPKLIKQTEGYLARGFDGVKIKIGQPDLADDVARAKAIRDVIGPDNAFMVDANYSMSVPQAIEAARAFEPFDLLWFEEPTIPDNYKGYGEIASATLACLWRWAKISIPCMNSNMPARMRSCPISSPTRPIAVVSQVGFKWPSSAANMACPPVAMVCKSCTSVLSPHSPTRV